MCRYHAKHPARMITINPCNNSRALAQSEETQPQSVTGGTRIGTTLLILEHKVAFLIEELQRLERLIPERQIQGTGSHGKSPSVRSTYSNFLRSLKTMISENRKLMQIMKPSLNVLFSKRKSKVLLKIH